MSNETIAALATPPGRGGIGIVRVSGPKVATIAEALLGAVPAARKAVLRRFRDAQHNSIDEGVALYFPAPNSFTGEDVLELQGHGGTVVMDMLLAEVCRLGARPARPGEFSERAFINDRIDLTQAEAIADLIDSGSSQAARAALRSLEGEFSRQVNVLSDEMVQLRIYVEAAIDFPEEEIDFLADDKVSDDVRGLLQSLQKLMNDAQQGCVLREGLVLVIAGLPNAGKSSLLNALAARDTAIVTEIPGTTRDVLRETIQIDGLPLQLIDTAGLREAGDVVEQEGIRRAWQEIEKADRILFVVDDQQGMTAEANTLLGRFPTGLPVTIVHNKIDLSQHAAVLEHDEQTDHVYVSARAGLGIETLKTHLKDCAGYRETTTDTFSARRRHLDALRRATELVEHGLQALEQAQAGELLAEDLRQAHHELGEITGEYSSDDLLGAIFSSFCIGK